MNSENSEPINLRLSELVTIDQLVDIIGEIAGIGLKRTYDLNAPKGVNGRNGGNAMILEGFGWEPLICLREGLEKTYRWIEAQMTEDAISQKYGLMEAFRG